MAYYPVMLDLQGKNCLVVGGGKIAIRKVISLLRAGSSVTVISTDFNIHFQKISSSIKMIERPFSESDISSGFALVIGATNDTYVNNSISRISASLGIPCNIVDCPELCSFIVPAVIRRGDLTIAVSTGGSSPRFSRYIKNQIAQSYGPEYKQITDYFSNVRKQVKLLIKSPSDRFLFWETLFDTDPVEFVNKHGWVELSNKIEQLFQKFQQRAGTR